MNKLSRQQLYQAAEQAALPPQAVGASQIEIIGARQILLTGHQGIRSYDTSEIVVELRDCAVSLSGGNLGIVSMTKNELLLGGDVECLRFLR